ncbi:SOS response-associated peptidase [Microvirga sp. W0021]|uniref:Abasic site processing protein n=1 Tax=Hohaiivirga grylli TaxID=3133970 RepID=A0ABV0BJ08_9HYPH
MCGRYALTLSPEILREFYDYVEQPNFPPRYNIAPTQPVPVVVQDSRVRHFRLMRWGFIPEWVKDPGAFPLLVNARSESLRYKPSFKTAIRHRRCIFMADAFYEWKRTGNDKQPFMFRMKSGGPLPMAGLWETYADPDGGEIDTVAVVTTNANGLMAPIHDRMPVILGEEGIKRWLATGVYSVKEALAEAKACPDDWLNMTPVSKRINSAREDDADLQVPVELKKELLGPKKNEGPVQGSLF